MFFKKKKRYTVNDKVFFTRKKSLTTTEILEKYVGKITLFPEQIPGVNYETVDGLSAI